MIQKRIINGADEITFVRHSDERGALVSIEGNGDVDFSIGRIYYITGVPSGSVRGKHAHVNLKQVLQCVKGSCTVDLDNGAEQACVSLWEGGPGIYIHGLMWREMRMFSPDCVLMAIVDKKYDRNDYIFDYKQFRSMTEEKES